MQAFRERCGSAIRGKFHSGFLQRALKFPMETILSDDNFKNSKVVLCGHSLGGAIASIVAIRIQQEKVSMKEFRIKVAICIQCFLHPWSKCILVKMI